MQCEATTVPIMSNLSFTCVKPALYMKLHEPLAHTHLAYLLAAALCNYHVLYHSPIHSTSYDYLLKVHSRVILKLLMIGTVHKYIKIYTHYLMTAELVGFACQLS